MKFRVRKLQGRWFAYRYTPNGLEGPWYTSTTWDELCLQLRVYVAERKGRFFRIHFQRG